MKAISVVITDLDDTLWDWVGIWYESFKAMLDQLERDSGIERDVLIKDFKEVYTRHNTTEYSFAIEELASLQEQNTGEDLTVVYANSIKAYRKARKAALKTYPTVLKTLKTLKGKGVLLVGYTESMSFYTRYRLRNLGIDHFFDYLYSPRDHELPENVNANKVRYYSPEHYTLCGVIHRFTPADKFKPSAEVLKDILNDLGAKPEETIYIGDKLHKDISMAQKAGVVDVWAKYGEAKDREEYELLRQVTHWPVDEVQKEKWTKAKDVKPSYTLENSFSDLLEYFEFAPFVNTAKDKLNSVIAVWEKTVDVQQHFNDIELKIRNFAITILIAAIGAAGFALELKLEFRIRGIKVPLASVLMFAGVLGIGLMWFMDRLWYHRLLYGAVEHACSIEQRHIHQLPEIGLSQKIKDVSPVKIWGWNLHSTGKLDLFYFIIVMILIGGAIVTFFCKSDSSQQSPAKSSTITTVNQTVSESDPCSLQIRGFKEPSR